MIPLRVKSRSESQHDSQLFHTVGLAFAGNTLIATNCHSLASTLTQNLWSEGEVVIPSLASVAKLYASVAEYITKDYNSRLQFDDFQKAEMFIFGYCAIAKRLILYFIHPVRDDQAFHMQLDEVDLPPGSACSIGSGAPAFRELSISVISRGDKVGPFEIFQHVVESQLVGNVGGHIQMMEAGFDGAKINLVLDQSKDDPDRVALSFLGFDISAYGDVDGLVIGNDEVSYGGTGRTSVRAALRARSIDPDGPPVSQTVENLAVFETCIANARATGKMVSVAVDYTLEPWRPEREDRCLGANCKKCGKLAALCRDIGWTPTSTLPLEGQGRISTLCNFCGEKVVARVEEIQMIAWRPEQ
jgi:hypothetical protein